MSELTDDLALALLLADEARGVALSMFRGSYGKRVKPDGSVVTDADVAVEERIRDLLARERPDDAILGEEFGHTGDHTRRWILDPIDGTQSFVEGSTSWGSLIALEDAAGLAVGVCDMGPIDRRYWAARGAGAHVADAGQAPRSIRVSGKADITGSRCFVPDGRWLPDDAAQRAALALKESASMHVPGDHPALEVAAGDADIAVFFMGGPWDIAAPAIVVQEAGGLFTDLSGGASLMQGGGLFTNRLLHADALAAVTGTR